MNSKLKIFFTILTLYFGNSKWAWSQTTVESSSPPISQQISKEIIPYYGLEFATWIDLENLKNEDLRAMIHKILTWKHVSKANSFDQIVEDCPEVLEPEEKCYGHRSLDYAEARRYLFGQIHLSEDGKSIRDIYALHEFTQDDFGSQQGPAPQTIPYHEILNTEHTWPQSRFNKNGGGELIRYQKGDLHHLFPSANRLNSYRQNYPFGETGGEIGRFITSSGNFYSECRRGQPLPFIGIETLPNIPSIVFQPPEETRGNIARALFYFSVRYELSIDPVEEYYLRRWHWQDPIDEFERNRNEQVFGIQNNRNPFIDYPELVDHLEDF